MLVGHCTARREAAAKGDDRLSKLPSVVSAASAVVAAINTTELAAFMALRPPADNEDSSDKDSSSSDKDSSSSSSYKEQKAEREKQKAALLQALGAMLKAQLDLAEVGLWWWGG
jgi:hypothetical protein